MRRIIVWAAGTVAVLVLLFTYPTSTSSTGSGGTETVISAGVSSGFDAESTAGTTGSQFSGSVVQTRYGPVQVQISVDGEKITDVSVLQYPDGDPRSSQINDYALPVLIQETLDAQSASVDMVSGATYTSQGYAQSLQNALDQAGL